METSRRVTANDLSKRIGEGNMARTKAAQPEAVTIPALRLLVAEITLVGDSPLISNCFSDEAKSAMLAKQMKQASTGRAAKDPEALYRASLRPLPNGGYGHPAVAFKSAAVDACRSIAGIAMTEARGAFHVLGDLVEIHGDPTMREDVVRNSTGVADIRYRACFEKWWVRLRVRYNADVLSLEQLVNLFNVAGFSTGVGDWRPGKSKSGAFGMFHVATGDDGLQ